MNKKWEDIFGNRQRDIGIAAYKCDYSFYSLDFFSIIVIQLKVKLCSVSTYKVLTKEKESWFSRAELKSQCIVVVSMGWALQGWIHSKIPAPFEGN